MSAHKTECLCEFCHINRLREALEAMTHAYPYDPPCHDWEPKADAHNKAKRALDLLPKF